MNHLNHSNTTHQNACDAVQLTRQTLEHGVNQLPHEITERLRAARMQALAQTLKAPAQPIQKPSFWDWLRNTPLLAKTMVVLPVLAAAFFITQNIQNPAHAPSEMALNASFKAAPLALMNTKTSDTLNIDAILNEKIPLQAYLDDDFSQYLERDIQSNKARMQPVQQPMPHSEQP